MQKGDGDAAIAWLKSIPQRFLPREIEQDPVFAPVRDRAEFKALFRPAGSVAIPHRFGPCAADAVERALVVDRPRGGTVKIHSPNGRLGRFS